MRLKEISDALEPVVFLIKTFSKEKFDYSKSEDVLCFVLKKLSKAKNSDLAKTLFESIVARIKQRRNGVLATSIKFLNGKLSFRETNDHLDYSDKETTLKFLEDQYERLFGDDDSTPDYVTDEDSITIEESDQDDEEDQDGSEEQQKTIEEELEEYVQSKKMKTADSKDSLRAELEKFIMNKTLGSKLRRLKAALESVQVTSTNAERCFSIAGNFCRKRRNRIGCLLLNSLVILCNL